MLIRTWKVEDCIPPTKNDNAIGRLNIKIIKVITNNGKIKTTFSKSGLFVFLILEKKGLQVVTKQEPALATNKTNKLSIDWLWLMLLIFSNEKSPRKDPIKVDDGYINLWI